MNADDYNADEITSGRLTVAHITKLVRAFQRQQGLVVDGAAGPNTRKALEAMSQPTNTIPLSDDERLAQAGRDAIAKAVELWVDDIFDPKVSDQSPDAELSRTRISSMIGDGLGWTWEIPYKGDGTFEWCGAFAALCWASIKPALRKTYYSSTYRLDRYARYQSAQGETNPRPAAGPFRLIANLDENSTSVPFTSRAGDILLIGPTGSGYGKHICLVESFDGKIFRTIEGNGTGKGPNGERQHGVIRGERPLGGKNVWHARRLVRPSVQDLGV